MFIDGEPVGPAVVVFGDGSETDLRASLQRLSPIANSAVCSVQKISNGTARSTLHCKASNVVLVHGLVDLMRAEGWQCAVYEDRQRQSGKAGQAAIGLAGAVMTTGLCKHFQAGRPCPHTAQNGRCMLHCWTGPPRA